MKTLKILFLFLSLSSVGITNLPSQTPQFPSSFPWWNTEPTGVSFPNISVYGPDKEYDLGGEWYYTDSEEGWITLEKPFSSQEGGNYESWVLATITDSGVDFFINDIYDSTQRTYKYRGSKLSDLTLEGHYEWKMGPNGYNEDVLTPPLYPVVQTLNLGALNQQTGQDYLNSFLPNADFSYTEESPTLNIIKQNATKLTIGLKYENGNWVSE
jgi:hypothetical protein